MPDQFLSLDNGFSKLYFSPDAILYAGPVPDNLPHRHYLLQLVLHAGQDYTLKSEGTSYQNESAVLIGSEQLHQLEVQQHIILLFADPVSPIGQVWQRRYLNHSTIALPDIKELQLTELLELLHQNASPDLIKKQLQQSIASFKKDELYRLDERIAEALKLVQEYYQQEQKITAGMLAEAVHLSESRFAHLFKEQTGAAVRHYLQWLKVQQAISWLLQNNCTLTEAAHAGGFTDSAHFSHTFKKMTGIAPSEVTCLQPA